MPFRDITAFLILGYVGPYPPDDDVPYIDIGDTDKGRLYIYYDASTLNIVSKYWIGQANVEIELGPDTDETSPGYIAASNSTAFGAPRFEIVSGRFDGRTFSSITLYGAAGEDSDPAGTDEDTPFILFTARHLTIRPPVGNDYRLGYRLEQDIDTANSGNVTGTETIIMTLTEALNIGATYRLSFRGHIDTSVSGDDASVKIREDDASGTILNQHGFDIPSASFPVLVSLEGEYTATVDGNKTFVVTLVRTAGTGNLVKVGAATQPAYFYLDYIRN